MRRAAHLGLGALVVACGVGAEARGLYLEPPPWYSPTLADTALGFGAGMFLARGDTSAVLFPVSLQPLRRGPLQIAFTWGFVSVRTPAEHVFGLDDPTVFARLRLAGDDASGAVLRAEGAGRLPTAATKLYPYAHGGQEIVLGGSLGIPAWWRLHVGGGRHFTEPASGSGRARRDVPHATALWLQFGPDVGRFAVRLRGDVLWLRGGGQRRLVQGECTLGDTRGLRTGAVLGFEFGAERVVDARFGLRFAMALR